MLYLIYANILTRMWFQDFSEPYFDHLYTLNSDDFLITTFINLRIRYAIKSSLHHLKGKNKAKTIKSFDVLSWWLILIYSDLDSFPRNDNNF